MNIDELKKSTFLKRSDVANQGRGTPATIAKAEFMNVAKEGAPEELKRVLWFQELDKPMVMNSTNGEIIAKITGSRDDDHWTGHKVVLYDDPNISFQGKLVGGIRVRAPRTPVPQNPGPRIPVLRPDDPKPMSAILASTKPIEERQVIAGDPEDADENPY